MSYAAHAGLASGQTVKTSQKPAWPRAGMLLACASMETKRVPVIPPPQAAPAGLRRLDAPPVVALLLANAVPLAGVFVWRWEVFPLLLLFWFENVIIGVFNALKMLVSAPAQPVARGLKLFLVPFFGCDWRTVAVQSSRNLARCGRHKTFASARSGPLTFRRASPTDHPRQRLVGQLRLSGNRRDATAH